MFIFIDESGIHKLTDHSIISFAYVCFEDVEQVENEISEIEESLGIKKFHWSNLSSKSGWEIREKFLKAVSKLNFTFKVAIMNNPIDMAVALEYSLEYLVIEKKIKKIIIDGKKPRWYSQRLKKVLRDKGIAVSKIRTLNDESSAGLRLADALAGFIRSHRDKPTERTTKLYKLLENKITAQLMGGQNAR
jgi:hypothetical protein